MTNPTLPQNATRANFDLFPFAHDFVLDGVPKIFTRFNGRLVPAVGAEVITSHGIGYIERATGDHTVIVRIVDFETAPVKLQSGEVSRESYVARLADLYNNALFLDATWVLQRYGDTKANRAKADEILSLAIDDDCFEARVGEDYLGATEFLFESAVAPKLRDRKKTRQELKAEQRAYEAEFSDDEDTPDWISSELEDFDY